jgi:hypothetical protein
LQKRWGLLLIPLILSVALVYPLWQSEAPGLSANVVETVHLTAIVGHPNDTIANWGLVWEGYSPSCWVGCHGIYYTQDPTVHVVNQGIDCIQSKVHGTGHAITCYSRSSANGDQNVTYTYVSVSGGATPAFTDTTCPATIQTSDGYSVAAGTVAAGTPSSGSATLTISHTWTDATAQVASIDLACIGWSSTTTSTVYAEGQIGSTTTNPGDTLETIWSITYSSS